MSNYYIIFFCFAFLLGGQGFSQSANDIPQVISVYPGPDFKMIKPSIASYEFDIPEPFNKVGVFLGSPGDYQGGVQGWSDIRVKFSEVDILISSKKLVFHKIENVRNIDVSIPLASYPDSVADEAKVIESFTITFEHGKGQKIVKKESCPRYVYDLAEVKIFSNGEFEILNVGH